MLRALLSQAPVIPVVTIHDLAHAVPLAEALCAGGLTVIEVTLRTAAALPAIQAMRKAVPQAVIGAGTVVSREQLAAAVGAGSQFLVSPGFSAALGAEARRAGVPLLPGIATPTELMAALEAGFTRLRPVIMTAFAMIVGMLRAPATGRVRRLPLSETDCEAWHTRVAR